MSSILHPRQPISSFPTASPAPSAASASSSPAFLSPIIVLSNYDYDIDNDSDHTDHWPGYRLSCRTLHLAAGRTSPALHDPYRRSLIGPTFSFESIAQHSHRICSPGIDRTLPPHPQPAAPLTEYNVSCLRSLTEKHPVPFQGSIRLHHDDMTSFAQPPGSPPGLTSSKSSKSSSFQSSSFSSPDGVYPDLSHFEDIGLDDEQPPASACAPGRADFKDSPRQSSTSVASGKLNSPAIPTRELVNGTPKPSQHSPYLPSPGLSGPGSRSALSLPNSVRRSPSSITPLPSAAPRNGGPSRSPSPSHQNSSPASPRSIPSGSPAFRPGVSPIMRRPPGSRRASSNRSRRTTAEIEADCTDDADEDDLPEDASLWNVPLSPILFRTASSAASSAVPSSNNSPDRPHYLETPSLRRDGVQSPRTAPTSSKAFSPVIDSVPASPLSPRMPRAVSDSFAFGKARAKSWSNVLSDLSEETLSLSQALDAHANESGAGQGSDGGPMPRSPRRAQSAFVELPPLRRNNVMIDPLPISKEKERVLSRTRPSWLPPKSQREERRHLKEYQKMMEHSLEAEKRRAAQAASDRCARDDSSAALQRIWDEYVLPDWDAAVRLPRTRELFWRGVPARVRPWAWRRAIRNELGLTSTTYEKALARANATRASMASLECRDARPTMEHAWLHTVDANVARTLPDLRLFQKGQRLHRALVDVLSAYALYRTDIGPAAHGMAATAGLLLLTFAPPSSAVPPQPTGGFVADAFIALANLLNRPLPLAFATSDRRGMARAGDLVAGILATKRPRLHAHLFGPEAERGLALDPARVIESMVGTLFLLRCCDNAPIMPPEGPATEKANPVAGHAASDRRGAAVRSSCGLSLECVRRLWDVVVFDGDAAVVRACAGLLAAAEPSLYGSAQDVTAMLDGEGVGFNMGLDVSTGAGPGEGADARGRQADAFMCLIREMGKAGPPPEREAGVAARKK